MFEELPSLSFLQFFAFCCDCHYSKKFGLGEKFLLPSLSELSSEESFSKVFVAWNEENVLIELFFDVPFQEVNFTDFRKGDSVEIFIDTRNLKKNGYVTKFSHHFVFFPDSVYGKELTKFRMDDAHLLADPAFFKVKSRFKKNSYSMNIEIASKALFGFDPENFKEFGFTYRINRFNGLPQFFVLSSEEFNIEKHPDLWSTMKVVK